MFRALFLRSVFQMPKSPLGSKSQIVVWTKTLLVLIFFSDNLPIYSNSFHLMLFIIAYNVYRHNISETYFLQPNYQGPWFLTWTVFILSFIYLLTMCMDIITWASLIPNESSHARLNHDPWCVENIWKLPNWLWFFLKLAFIVYWGYTYDKFDFQPNCF